MPRCVQAWPSRAACWSPAIPAMGMRPAPSKSVSPYTALESRTSGSPARGGSRSAQFVAQARGAPVLPHDGVVNRLPGAPVPHHRGLALVGDADGGDVAPRQAGLGDGLGGDAELRRPDLVGVVLDPARLREDLTEFLLRDGLDPACVIEHDRAGTGGALIEREHVLHVHPPVVSREPTPVSIRR